MMMMNKCPICAKAVKSGRLMHLKCELLYKEQIAKKEKDCRHEVKLETAGAKICASCLRWL